MRSIKERAVSHIVLSLSIWINLLVNQGLPIAEQKVQTEHAVSIFDMVIFEILRVTHFSAFIIL